MKKLVGILIVLMLLFIGANSYAVNTITFTSPTVMLIAIDADWSWTETLGSGMSRVNIISITFIPTATDDHCVIKDTNGTGPTIFEKKAATAFDSQTIYYPQPNAGFKPFLDVGDGSYTAGAKVIIILGQ